MSAPARRLGAVTVAGFLAGFFAVGSLRVGGEAASDLLGLFALVLATARDRSPAADAAAFDRQAIAGSVAAFGGSAFARALPHEAMLGAAVCEAAAKLALCEILAWCWRRAAGVRRQASSRVESGRAALAELMPAVGCGLLWLALRAGRGAATAGSLASLCATVRLFGIAAAVLGLVRSTAALCPAARPP